MAKKSAYSTDAYLTLNTKHSDLPSVLPYKYDPSIFNYKGTPFGDTLCIDDSGADPSKIFFLLKLEIVAQNDSFHFVRLLFPFPFFFSLTLSLSFFTGEVQVHCLHCDLVDAARRALVHSDPT